MPERPARPLAASVVLIAALALTGCATQATDASGASTDPAPAAEQAPEPTTDTTDASDEAAASEDTAAAPAEGAYLDYTDGAIEATAGPKALFFHASWCPKCRALDEDLRAEGAPDGLTVFKVDYDSRTDLRQQYGVTIQTTIVFVDDAGEKISSVVLYEDPSVESLVAAMP
ncbi:thioredoxin [Agromyces kandeliae]|uniref:Thioredoxin n=1 Tax=Agromyces kandeliae TaxID=2666141 RepID=A0A6L5R2Y3_9MICO|nr:thioredoxin family protein [Agromyces kandeliae]MRX43914.1 thioredoxin [Agromyces kandeliae]